MRPDKVYSFITNPLHDGCRKSIIDILACMVNYCEGDRLTNFIDIFVKYQSDFIVLLH